MKITILKLLDRIIPHRRGLSNRNKAEGAALDQSHSTSQDEALEKKTRIKIPSLQLSAFTNTPASVQENVPILVERGTTTRRLCVPRVYAASHDRSPDTEDLSMSEGTRRPNPSLLNRKPRREFALNGKIVPGGILGIRGPYGVNRRLGGRPLPQSRTFPLDSERFPVEISFQEEQEQEQENEEPDEADCCSRYPLCKICQAIIRRYPSREWYAPVLSTKKSLQERASEGCPLCMLYLQIVAPYLSEATVIASPSTSSKGLRKLDVEGTSITPSTTTGQETEELLLYKRDTGSKLVLHFLSKKYTVVFDWKYSWVGLSRTGNSFFHAATTI
jgi:hypothetical protein